MYQNIFSLGSLPLWKCGARTERQHALGPILRHRRSDNANAAMPVIPCAG